MKPKYKKHEYGPPSLETKMALPAPYSPPSRQVPHAPTSEFLLGAQLLSQDFDHC